MPAASPAERRIYRLALYGVRSSGKTCILSALSLPRIANPNGLSCSWIENVPGHEPPPDDPNSWDSNDPYHIGWQWLNEQRKRLRAGDLPEANPNRDPMRFLFDFGSPEHGTRQVELIDYSGELITASASELAATLQNHMRECDGLLILAEAPRPNGDWALLADDLGKLTSAFHELLDQRADLPRQEWPIALLFNKWDRRHSMPAVDHGKARELLDKFLGQHPSPPHASLLNTIRNAVGADNVRCFPVSAFGVHEIRDDGAEVPLLHNGQLQSFALEEGFVWVTQRRDELAVEQLETASDAIRWWAFPRSIIGAGISTMATEKSPWKQWFRGVSPLMGLISTWKSARQLAKGSELRRRVNRARRQFGVKFASHMTLAVLAGALFLISIETLFDGMDYRDIDATRNNPSADIEELTYAVNWLKEYYSAPAYRHLLSRITVLSRTDATVLLQKYQNELVQAQDRANRNHLARIEFDITAFRPTRNTPLDSLLTLRNSIYAIPYLSARSKATTDHQKELSDQIADKYKELMALLADAEWETFQKTYWSLMDIKNTAEAARLLTSRNEKDKRLKELCDDFEKRASAHITSLVQDDIKNRSWASARNSAEIIKDPNVQALLPQSTVKELGKLTRAIDEAEDQDLYAQILQYKPGCADQVHAYLTRAPLKTMEKEVNGYQSYLRTLKGPLELKLNLSEIRWADGYWVYGVNLFNDVTVKVNSRPLIAKAGLKSTPNERSIQIGNEPFTAQLSEQVKVEIDIIGKYFRFGSGTLPGGSGEWSGTPSQLLKGVTIDLKGDGFTNKATFTVSGVPAEPPLPEWRSR